MSEPQDDSVELSELARSIFGRAREGDPPPETIDALRHALANKLGSPPSSGDAPGSGDPGVATSMPKLGWALGGVASVIIIASFIATRVADPGAHSTTVGESSSELEGSSEVSTSHAESTPEVLEPESSTPAEPAVDTVARHRIVFDEAQYIESVRRAVEVNPSRALRLARAHSSRFSAPTLAEEARALEVEALARMGRESDALRAADSFFARFPETPYRRRVERALGALHQAEP